MNVAPRIPPSASRSSRPDLAALRHLVETRFAAREALAHEHAALPLDNLRELHDGGWLRLTLPDALGGADSRLGTDDPGTYLQAIRTIARVSPGTAHCLQVHNHALWTVWETGTPSQHARFLAPQRERLSLFAFLGSEPGLAPGAPRYQTTAIADGDGFRVTGVKQYATNGIEHGYGLAFASVDGPDGLIHNQQMVLVEPSMAGVTQIGGWYRPTGMRVAESPRVQLDDVRVPASHVLGRPGDYVRGRWQGRFHLGFAANYLGMGEGIAGWATDWLRDFPERVADPFVQAHVGEVAASASAWPSRARWASRRARSCSTNRSPRSTFPFRRRSSICSRISSANRR